ncbi:hypothetical protein [Bacillus sp. KH172YL63]|uniref:hypothetical protein n=1 Tax=Bacillus sp. KH172YL63 TaxID=2709784 RepID=UPI0015636D26|nr:hypothetical protein [Bacillus sp. KH172YL63]
MNELVTLLKGKTNVMKELKRENHLESKLTSLPDLNQSQQKKYTDIIISNSRRANRLIHDLFTPRPMGTEGVT